MKKSVLVLSLLSSMIWLRESVVPACGHKFLVAGRGVKYMRGASLNSNPHLVLIYKNPESGLPLAAMDPELEKRLRKIGHKVRTANGWSDLADAVRSDRYEIILVDVADIALIKAHLHASSPAPVLLPVLHKPTKDEMNVIKKQFAFVLKATRSTKQVHETIEQALHSKAW